MQTASWYMDILRTILYSLDKFIYGFVETLYNLLIYISDLTIFNNSDFNRFSTKVYLLLGMIMLFKIAFSLISLFANPDDLMDSQKGITGIVRRIIVSLVVITFVPTMFQTAYRIQGIILEDNIIGNFFLGDIGGIVSEEGEDKTVADIQKNSGKMVAFNVFSAFYHPEEFVLKYNYDGKNRVVATDKDENGAKKVLFELEPESWSSRPCVKQVCDGRLYYKTVYETYSLDDYGEFVKKDSRSAYKKTYIMRYTWLLSSIAGIALVWIFFSYCFDVAIRVIKLSVLQLIAPIPVFSYIDPKKGNEIFTNWYKECIKSYLSLFGRLVIIYFVIYICYLLCDTNHGLQQFNIAGLAGDLEKGNSLEGWARVFIIFGLLYFALKAPKYFSDMFGIKMESSFGTTLMKSGLSIAGAGLGMAALGGVGKFGTGFGKRHLEKKALRKEVEGMDENDPANYQRFQDIKKELSFGAGFKHSMRAMGTGITSGFMTGAQNKKMTFGLWNQSLDKANVVQRRRDAGKTLLQDTGESVAKKVGYAGEFGTAEEDKREIKRLQNAINDANRQEVSLREEKNRNFNNVTAKYDIPYELGKAFQKAMSDRADTEKEKGKGMGDKAVLEAMEKIVDNVTTRNPGADIKIVTKEFKQIADLNLYQSDANATGMKLTKEKSKLEQRQIERK